MFVLLTLITGVAYPAIVTLLAQGIFPYEANGSVFDSTGKQPVAAPANTRDWWGAGQSDAAATESRGSELIGQPFSSPRYFWSRPSATGPVPYNGGASTGSNLGPTNPAQLDAVKQRVEALRNAGGDQKSPVPIDLVTASGSGLDPHISPAAADYQVPRIAKERGLGEYEVRRLVAEHTAGRTFGVLGEPRVNVLELNLALDKFNPTKP
jgi:K+-transporting ATPase ATPase C chain